MKFTVSRAPLAAVGIVCLGVSGCAAPDRTPAPLIFQRSASDRASGALGTTPQGPPAETPVLATPRTPAPLTGNVVPAPTQPEVPMNDAPGKNDVTVSLEQMPLAAFIQTMYGGILKINYSVDAAVASRTDLITFRTPRPLSPARLTELTRLLLASYGVAVQDFGGVVRVVPSTATASILPQIRRGRAQPGVPLPLRPIFNYIELDAVRATAIIPTVKKVLGEKVQIQEDAANGVLLSGNPEDVQVALDVLRVFDQPNLKGQRSVRVAPRFWSADEFSKRLTEILRVEGYAAANTADAAAPVVVLPIPNLNSVVVFAQTDEILAHALDWSRELDQLSQVQAGNSMFIYPVRNADATDLARALNDLISGTVSAPTTNAGAAAAPGSAPASAPAATAQRRRGVVVNNATNSLIFQGGNQEEYRQWLGLLTEMDKPARSALIDVMVAEVTLSDQDSLGFSWTIDRLAANGAVRGISRATLNSNGQFNLNAFFGGSTLHQLAIDALAASSNTRVISNPKLMARNGETANISVGQDVPTVASQAISGGNGIFGGNSTVVPQTIQYRTTGVLLRVRPVIHSGDRIDLDISQEVSSAVQTTTGVVTSPTINNRKVETKLTLRDGGTVMLAGLISETNVNRDSGVPYVKDIPILGNLFKSQGRSNDRTELVILLTPYILNDSEEAEGITEAYQQSLGVWAKGLLDRTRLTRSANPPRAIDPLRIDGAPAAVGGPAVRRPTGLPAALQPSALPASSAPAMAPAMVPAQGGAAPGTIFMSTPQASSPGLAPAPAGVGGSVPATGGAGVGVGVGAQAAGTQPPSGAAATATGTQSPPAMPPIPPGSKVVTDPALLEELRRAFNR